MYADTIGDGVVLLRLANIITPGLFYKATDDLQAMMSGLFALHQQKHILSCNAQTQVPTSSAH